MTAAADGDVVVFLIGSRINHYWAPWSWLPVLLAMFRMLRELSRDREAGLLGYRVTLGGPRDFGVVQYWQSRHKLFAYASDTAKEHRPAWSSFNRHARKGGGHVGIWHETYLVPDGHYENVYVHMPSYGLGSAYGTVPVSRRGDRAADRLKHRTAGDVSRSDAGPRTAEPPRR
ncbi:DUF4188 domain-containing protein [Streptomyces sp. NPDC091292]|uniref:DUF4188 domain-containing protein n=1 Tax=Streptomyces sp. NPDC091292 TaxID=3365991 RepID=UPI0037FC21E7